MNKCLKIYFSITLCVVNVSRCQSGGGNNINVILYEHVNHRSSEDRRHQYISTCSNVSEGLLNKIKSIDTRGHCARLYDTPDCDDTTGSNIEIMARSPSHLNLQAWGFMDKTVSVGVCRDSCSTDVTGFLPDQPFNVEIFTGIQYQGIMRTVAVEGCTKIPSDMVNKTLSVRAFDKCVQLYNNENCEVDKDGWQTIELRLGTPYHDDLRQWSFYNTVSISHCAYKCNGSTSAPNANMYLEDEDIILYNSRYFKGSDLYLTLENITCLNLVEEWEGKAVSIQVGNNTCVVLYDRKNCTGLSYTVTSSESDLNQRYFGAITRSMKSCNNEKLIIYQNDSIKLGLSPGVFAAVVMVPTLAVLITMTLIVCIAGQYRSILLRTRLSEKEIKEFREGLRVDLEEDGDASKYEQYSVNILAGNCPYNEAWEISQSRILYDSKVPIGMGEFGVVFKGKIRLSENTECSKLTETKPVAIKTAKPGTEIQYLRTLLKEVKVMLYVGSHKHIAQIVGCCTEDLHKGKILVLMEYYSNGSLESFLVKNRASFKDNLQLGILKAGENSQNCSTEYQRQFQFPQLLQWCLEVASGMEFLSLSKVIHADLAARNILLTEKLTAKISDFGLSRQLYTYSQYVKKRKEPLPWRWLALESLKNLEFSCQSDVWSFGILCWEIFTLGEKPYPGVTYDFNFVFHLENGLRPAKPKYGTMQCYEIMVGCWDDNPSKRPTFTELHQKLSTMLNSHFS